MRAEPPSRESATAPVRGEPFDPAEVAADSATGAVQAGARVIAARSGRGDSLDLAWASPEQPVGTVAPT
jgi:hypothetical protein